MDILTQGLLGAVLAQTAARKEEKKLATLAGFIAGLVADADILIGSSTDPLLTIEYHRHFTHSLLFVPVGAAIACMLLWPFLRKHIAALRLYVFCLLGYSMSGVLDACTSYGTHLFWPFTDTRVAWNIISIIDPFFTLVLFVSVLLGLRLSHRNVARTGMIIAAAYLGAGYVQGQRALVIADALAQSRGHEVTQHVVKPTLGNLVLWRSIYIANNHIYVDAVRVGIFDNVRVYAGTKVKQFDPVVEMKGLLNTSVLYKDIQRFNLFSDGYIARDPARPDVVGDMRYSMLPMSMKPLWGIVIMPESPHRHADYLFFRDNSKPVRQTFINMLMGRCAAAVCK